MRAVVRLDDGSDVIYRDVRRFGTWDLLEPGELEAYFAARRLGVEPLGRAFTAAAPRAVARGPEGSGEGGPPRPARRRRDREHLRGRGALVRADPSARAGRQLERRAGGRAAPGGAQGAAARHPPPGRHPARLPRRRREPRDACRTSSASTAARASRASAAGRRSPRRGSRAAARGSALRASRLSRIERMEPWSFEPAGPLRGSGRSTATPLRGNAARRSARAPALGLPAAGLRRRAGSPLPGRLHDPGPHRPARHVAQPRAVPAQLPRARRRALRRRRRAARGRRLGGLLDVARTAASSSTRRGPATTTPTSATRSCPGWTPAIERSRAASTAASPASRAAGYGAMVTPMLRPDLFGGLATHAGDALFEICYLPDFREVVRVLRDDYEGSYDRFWEDFRSRPAFCEGERRRPPQRLVHGRLLLGRPGRHGPPALRHGHRRAASPDVWARWLDWDPVRMVPQRAGGAPVAAGGLHRRRARATSTTSTSAPRRSGARSPTSVSPTSTSSSSTRRTWPSSTATRSRSPTWPSGSRRASRELGRAGPRRSSSRSSAKPPIGRPSTRICGTVQRAGQVEAASRGRPDRASTRISS